MRNDARLQLHRIKSLSLISFFNIILYLYFYIFIFLYLHVAYSLTSLPAQGIFQSTCIFTFLYLSISIYIYLYLFVTLASDWKDTLITLVFISVLLCFCIALASLKLPDILYQITKQHALNPIVVCHSLTTNCHFT